MKVPPVLESRIVSRIPVQAVTGQQHSWGNRPAPELSISAMPPDGGLGNQIQCQFRVHSRRSDHTPTTSAHPSTADLRTGQWHTTSARMHPLRSDRRNTEGGCRQILWTACRLEGCRAAIARSDLQQPHRPAGGGWMLAGLEQLSAFVLTFTSDHSEGKWDVWYPNALT
jgi:hypothetical protein